MKSNLESLQNKIRHKEAKICILGLGYVGLSLAVRISEVGFPVLGIDIDQDKVESIKQGISYIEGVPSDPCRFQGIHASTDFSLLRESDVSIICVPTPLSKTRDPDLSLILGASRSIAENLHPGQLIILESTTYPGTTREVLLPIFEKKGLLVGKDYFLAYSPERIDPGNDSFNLSNTPKVIAGITPTCSKLAEQLYGQVVGEVVPVSSTDTAEMVKLLENTFRSINIGLVNEFSIMCNRLGLDIWEVIRAASSKPYGFMPFYPGPGLGGHCIPVDPHYLSWKLRLLKYRARFIALADEINREMPRFVVEKVVDALNGERKSVKGSKIFILGVAYKKDSGDFRESPAFDIMKLLSDRGGKIFYHDPHVPEISFNDQILRSVPLNAESLSSSDVVVVITDHRQFNAEEVVCYAHLVVDSRNLTGGIKSEKIVRL